MANLRKFREHHTANNGQPPFAISCYDNNQGNSQDLKSSRGDRSFFNNGPYGLSYIGGT